MKEKTRKCENLFDMFVTVLCDNKLPAFAGLAEISVVEIRGEWLGRDFCITFQS